MEEKETGRLEGFSDGVIAVAITLLVLGLQPPPQAYDKTHLLAWLGRQVPNYLAFVTSFITIGVMWMNHHRMFTHIKRIDDALMVLNLLLLLCIVIVPFPTAMVALYLKAPNPFIAVLIFNGTYVMLAICFNVLLRYAVHENRLLGKQVDQHQIQAMLRKFRFGPLVYIITFGITWINVPISLLLNLLLAVFWAIPTLKRPSQATTLAFTDSQETTRPEQARASGADD